VISISGSSRLVQSAVVNYCLQHAELRVLAVTSLFGCACDLSVEEQGDKASKESKKNPQPQTTTVYASCVGSGKVKEEEGTRDALATSPAFPWLGSVCSSPVPALPVSPRQLKGPAACEGPTAPGRVGATCGPAPRTFQKPRPRFRPGCPRRKRREHKLRPPPTL